MILYKYTDGYVIIYTICVSVCTYIYIYMTYMYVCVCAFNSVGNKNTVLCCFLLKSVDLSTYDFYLPKVTIG